MSAVSATGVALPLPSKPNKHTLISSWSSLFSSRKSILRSSVRRKKSTPVSRVHCSSVISDHLSNHHLSSPCEAFSGSPFAGGSKIMHSIAVENLVLIDLDPATARLAIAFLGPFLSAFGFLFILRIVMSWYPKLPVEKFPYVVAYAPTEPFLAQTRKIIPPLGGVDVTPVV